MRTTTATTATTNSRQEDDAEPAVARECARTRSEPVGETNFCILTGGVS